MGALLRLIAVVACLIVALGFAGFVWDQAGDASKTQVGKLASADREPVPSAADEALRQRRESPVRERVDDANDILLSPFTSLTGSNNAWVARGVPTLLALLAYGLGLTLLANFLPRQGRHTDADWRTA
jgi:hypothetical protein